MRFSGSLLSSFILFVSSFSPFGKVLSQIVATFLGLWKCGVTIAECAHVHSSAQSAWNVYNLPRTAAAEISTELDESWMCVLRQYFCSRVDGLIPAASRRILFKHPWCLLTSVLVFESHLRRILLTRPWCLFRARPAFVLVCEDHLDFLPKCSRGILFVSFLGVEPFVTRREILYWHVCPCSEYVLV